MPEEKKPLILLAAGGTGGHLFPAEALATELVNRGCRTALVTDARIASGDWAKRFPGDVTTLTAGTVTGAGFVAKAMGALKLAKGTLEARALLARLNPDVVVGFGGYPTVPPILAASMKGIPTILHEANAVMGRANRFLARRATLIATGFPSPNPEFPDKTVFSGNPVRKPVLLAAESPYQAPEPEGMLELLVFGGSLGASVMSNVVPAAMQQISPALRARLSIVQQAREEDVKRVSRIYEALGVKHEIAPFFADLPHRIAAAHLVIARAGAMTVTELSVIGRPSVLVPLPGSLDQDQATNAAVIVAAGGAISVPQSAFTPVSLAELLERKMSSPERLAEMAAKAKSIGISDAASRLAGHVFSVLSKHAKR
ncbi:MAG: undecaprenyldiphospho-muramoylpentapeptide beta-N-acetylglucosaminyltransferase [Methylobacterium sp.]|nr:MAG: undecaprenyldiphospho-muramoylpentapeptide beta-N-acetylglucosaminyltransferase [Methylobacterium sp.]